MAKNNRIAKKWDWTYLRFTPEQAKYLKRKAKNTGNSVAFIVRQCIDEMMFKDKARAEMVSGK